MCACVHGDLALVLLVIHVYVKKLSLSLHYTGALSIKSILYTFMNTSNISNCGFFYSDEGEVGGLCGLHREYETADRYDMRKMYPWIAFISIQVKVSVFYLTS